MRAITEIIVHCTATRPDWWAGKSTAAKVAEIKRWHVKERGWSDIGYHYLIDRDGVVMKGRDIARDGAHVQGRNKGTIGVSLFGGHGSAETDQFSDHFTPQQDAALRNLIADLRKRFGNVPVTGHNQYAAKACPGFNVPKWLARAPAQVPPAAKPDHKPITPGMTQNPNQPKHWLTHVLAGLAAIADLFTRKKL
jgi:N-acetyl-anhydromuramyl-L-alanine amidase AmpD